MDLHCETDASSWEDSPWLWDTVLSTRCAQRESVRTPPNFSLSGRILKFTPAARKSGSRVQITGSSSSTISDTEISLTRSVISLTPRRLQIPPPAKNNCRGRGGVVRFSPVGARPSSMPSDWQLHRLPADETHEYWPRKPPFRYST